MRALLARRLAGVIDLEPVTPDRVPELSDLEAIRLGMGWLFSAFGLVGTLGMGWFAWILLAGFWDDWRGPSTITDPAQLDQKRSGRVMSELEFDPDRGLTVYSPKTRFTLYPPKESTAAVYRLQLGKPDKSAITPEPFSAKIRVRSRSLGAWSIKNQSIDLVQRFAAVGRELPDDAVVLEPTEAFDSKKMLANPLSVIVLAVVGIYLLFVLWRILVTIRLVANGKYRCRVMNRCTDLRSVAKIAAVTRGESLLDEEVEQLTKLDCLRLRLGWWGGLQGLALTGLAVLLALGFTVQFFTLAVPGDPETIEPSKILEQPNRKRIRTTVQPNFRDLIFVTGRRASASDMILIGAKDPELKDKVWIFREEGVTRGEEKQPPVEQDFEVIRSEKLLDWDLPAGFIDFSGRGRHRVSRKLDKSAIVLVPVAAVDSNPRTVAATIAGVSLAVVLLFLIRLRAALQAIATPSGRKRMLDKILGLSALPSPGESMEFPANELKG